MSRNKVLFLKNTASLYLMNIVKLVFPLLTLPYLTRTLSTETYGVVIYVKALIVYVQLVIDFGFLLSATKEIVFVAEDKEKIGRITGDTLAEKGILAIVAILFWIIALCFIPILSQNKLFSLLYLFSTLLTIFLFDFLFRGLEKMHLIAIPFVIAKSTTTFLTFIMIHGDENLLLIPVLEIIGNVVTIIISLYFVRKLEFRISFSPFRKWLKDLKKSSIYFISNFSTTIFGALTTVIAGFHLSMSNIAYWGICMQILSSAKALYNPITNTLYSHMLRGIDFQIIRKINIIMIIPMVSGSAIIMFASEMVLQILGGEKYIAAANVLRVLLPAFVFSFYSMLYGWPVLGVMGKIKETTTTTVLASLVQLCGLGVLILTNRFTLIGLAIISSLSEFTLFATRYFIYYSDMKQFKVDSGEIK